MTTGSQAEDSALSRIFIHKDGSRTEAKKHGNSQELWEYTYDINKHRISCRQFVTDTEGRVRKGIIYDGMMNPLATVEYNFDKVTGKTIEERTWNKKGKLLMRLMYPGTLADPKLANRYVAFHYNPDDPTAQPVKSTKNVKPVRPVEADQDTYESGVPQPPAEHRLQKPAPPKAPAGPPPPKNVEPSSPPPPAPPVEKVEKPARRSFLPQKPSS